MDLLIAINPTTIMGKLKIEKAEKVYRCNLAVSDYDYLEIAQAPDNRITVKFLDTRWRTPNETKKLFLEIAETLNSLPNF